jgi:hypothetical protein
MDVELRVINPDGVGPAGGEDIMFCLSIRARVVPTPPTPGSAVCSRINFQFHVFCFVISKFLIFLCHNS